MFCCRWIFIRCVRSFSIPFFSLRMPLNIPLPFYFRACRKCEREGNNEDRANFMISPTEYAYIEINLKVPKPFVSFCFISNHRASVFSSLNFDSVFISLVLHANTCANMCGCGGVTHRFKSKCLSRIFPRPHKIRHNFPFFTNASVRTT